MDIHQHLLFPNLYQYPIFILSNSFYKPRLCPSAAAILASDLYRDSIH